MKKIIPSFLLAASASSSLLLAQNAKITPETSNLSLAQYSNINENQAKLMMDPSILEEGAEALGEELGIFGKKTTSPKTALGTAAATPSSIGNSPSSATIAGQGVVNTMGEEIAAGNGLNAFLEEEICNNIYTSCLAKVAEMAQNKTVATGNNFEENEKIEWEAAKEMAAEEEEEFKNALIKAQKATEEAKEKSNSVNLIRHGEVAVNNAFYDYKITVFAEKLAEARVKMARATLNAIKFRSTAQRNKVEIKLKEAIEEEKAAAGELRKAIALREESQPSITSISGKNNQVSPSTPGKTSMGENGIDPIQKFNNLLLSSQNLLFDTPPKPPASEYGTAVASQTSSEKVGANLSLSPSPAQQGNLDKTSLLKANYGITTAPVEQNKKALSDQEALALLLAQREANLKAQAAKKEAELQNKEKLKADAAAELIRKQELLELEKARGEADVAVKKEEELMKQASEYRTKATEAQTTGHSESAATFNKAAEQVQAAANYYRGIAEAPTTGKVKEIPLWNKAAGVLKRSGEYLSTAAEYLSKATQSQAVGHSESAAIWNKAAEQAKEAAGYCNEAAKAHVSENSQQADSLSQGASTLVRSNDSLTKAVEWLSKSNEFNGHPEVVTLYTKAKEECLAAAEYYKKESQANLSGKKEETTRLYKAGSALDASNKLLSQAAESLSKAIEAQVAGQPELASLWTKISKQSQSLVEQNKAVFEAYASENSQKISKHEEASYSLSSSSSRLSEASEYLSKAAEAHIQGKPERASLWIKASEQALILSSDLEEGARAYVFENVVTLSRWKKANSFHCSKTALSNAAAWLSKADEAEIARQPEAALWIRAAEQSLILAAHKREEARVIVSGNIQKGEQWKAAYSPLSRMDGYLSDAAKFLSDITKARTSEISVFTTTLTKAAEQALALAEQSKAFAEANISGNRQELERWKPASHVHSCLTYNALSNVKKNLKSAIETQPTGKPEAVIFFIDQAEHALTAAEYFWSSIQAYVAGNIKKAEHWKSAGDSLEKSASCLENENHCTKKAIEAISSASSELSGYWMELSLQYHTLAEYYKKATESYVTGSLEEIDRVDVATESANSSFDKLKSSIKYLDNAAEAESSRDSTIATVWRKAAGQAQASGSYFHQLAQAYAQGYQKKTGVFDNSPLASAAQNAHYSANYLKESIEALSSGKTALAALLTKSSEQQQISSEYYYQASQVRTQGNEEEAKRLEKAGTAAWQGAQHLKDSAKYLEKASKAKSSKIAALWTRAMEEAQPAAEYRRQAADAFAQGNEEEGKRLDNAAGSAWSIVYKTTQEVERMER